MAEYLEDKLFRHMLQVKKFPVTFIIIFFSRAELQSKTLFANWKLLDKFVCNCCEKLLKWLAIVFDHGNFDHLWSKQNLKSHFSYFCKSNRKAMNRNWSNQKANPALKTKAGNK